MAAHGHRRHPDRHRAARVPAPTRPWPHRRGGQGMRRGRRRLVVAAALLAAACGNGETILNAGNEPATTLPIERRRRCRPATRSARRDAAARRDVAPDDTRPPRRPSRRRRRRRSRWRSLPRARSTHSRARRSTVELTFWHGLNAESETALTKLTDAYNAISIAGARRAPEPGQLLPDDRQVRAVEPVEPARPRDVPRVRRAADRRLRLASSRSARASRRRATTPARSSPRR